LNIAEKREEELELGPKEDLLIHGG